MRYFPVFMDLQDRDVLIVGGGEQALQKARLMLKTPARITFVSPSFSDEIKALGAAGKATLLQRGFADTDVLGKVLVYAATGEKAAHAQIAAVARAANIPVNVVDEPETCTFITPGIVDRDPLTIAIGTEGMAPVLARGIREKLEAELPARLGEVARAAGDLRDMVEARIGTQGARRRVYENLLKGEFRDAVLAGDAAAAARAAEKELARAESNAAAPGRVILVGCGPGDADLLTLKAQQALQSADVLVIDRLVSPAILDYARRDAERILVGKMPGGPSTPQEEINRILVREALLGKTVARLKGGDSFVFGRAAEEMTAVRAAGLTVEVIPGITAAHACAARLGLPLTLRGKVRQFSILTGATRDGEAEHDWHALSKPGSAFALYMGIGSGPTVQERMLAAGADPETSVVIIENGTLPNERAYHTTLADLAEVIHARQLTGPAIIFFGLDWADADLTRPSFVEPYSSKTPAIDPWTAGEIAAATQWVMG